MSGPTYDAKITLAIIIILLITGLAVSKKCSAAEHEFRMGTILTSWHADRNEEYNEEHSGLYLMYDGWMAGAYENSYNRTSYLLAKEWRLSDPGSTFVFSTTWGLANAYDDEGFSDTEYRPWVSLNLQVEPVKIWTAPTVIVFGLELEFN